MFEGGCLLCEPRPRGQRHPGRQRLSSKITVRKKTEPQGRMLAHIARTVALCNLWLISVKNATSCDSTSMPVNLFWQLGGCWDWPNAAASLTLFWFIRSWMSTHTHHHRPTQDIMPLWSPARVTESVSSECGSELKWWANGCDTATKAPSLFPFLLMIQCSWMNYECHPHSQK